MAVGTVTIGQTPCCGVIERTYEAWPDASSETGMWHQPGAFTERGDNSRGGPYAPTFVALALRLDTGFCPDCGERFR